VAHIGIYETLLEESYSPTGIDASVLSSFQPDSSTETRSSTRRYHLLIQLARALRERYFHTGHGPDFDAAIARGKAALTICGAESVLCPIVLAIYADLLETNFERTGDFNQLYLAESMCRQAIALCTTACRARTTACHTLSWIMYRLNDRVGTPASLDEAFNLQRRGLSLTAAFHGAEDNRYMRALVDCTLSRHADLGNPQDTDDAMTFLQRAFELCPLMRVNRMLIVHTMTNALQRKYFLCGRLEDPNSDIDLGRYAMANFPCGDRRWGLWNVVANLFTARYEAALSADCDLDELVNLRRELLQDISPNSTFRWLFTASLADGLRLRFMRTGELQDLEESIELCRRAIDIIPKGHPFRPKVFASLSDALCHRFHETRDVADLREVVDSDRYAIAAMSPLHVDYWHVSLSAISHLCIRFEVFQAVDDLDQAILLSEGLLNSIPHGRTQKDDTVRHLAKALLLRGAHLNAREDVDRAIREAVPFRKQLTQWAAAPQVVSRTLSASYLVRFRLNQDSCDIAHALGITNDLLNVVGPGHYERFQSLIHAAELYSELGTPFRDSKIALMHIAEAMSNNCRDVRSKIQGAKFFLDTVKIQYKDAWTTASPAVSAQLLDIYMSTINLLPQVAFFGLHLHSRLQSLAMGQNIALDGASHALNISLPERALEILEQGRAIFWNHTLRLRSPFDHVPEEFRDRLGYLARQLEKSSEVLRDTQDSRTIEKEAAQRRQHSEEFNSLVDQVRCSQGMERFLLHDEYATLAKAADRGPVIVLVSSGLTCHAIVVKSADEIMSIPLHSITESWLGESGDIWRTEVTSARSAVRDSRKMVKARKSTRSMSTKAGGILECLWLFVVFPVLDKLGLQVCCFL
jgi:tetratricopeptide (TPR) repeat protein